MYNKALSKILAVMVAVIIVSAAGASAKQNFMGGLHFNAGFPTGDFKDQIDKNAYGIGGQFFYSPSPSPFAIGVEVGFMNYGNEKRTEPFSLTVPDVTVDVTTSNNIVQGFLIFRGKMPAGPIRPYADALVGFNYLFTETKISDASDGDEVASSTNQDDAVFAYGFGGGVMVPIYKTPADKAKAITVSLDAGARYVIGGEAEYLKKGSIERPSPGVVTHEVIKSKTDMVRMHIGVVVSF